MIVIMEFLCALLLIKLVLPGNKIDSFYGFLNSKKAISDRLGAGLGSVLHQNFIDHHYSYIRYGNFS